MALSDAVPFAVAHWNLNEASGTRVDSVGSNDLADINTVGVGTGKFGNAADFESGNSESLSIADNADLSMGDTKFFIRCWVNAESSQPFARFVCKINSGVSVLEYQLFHHTGMDRLRFEVFDGSSLVGQAEANNFGAPPTGTWYLIHAWHDPDANQVGIAVNAGTADTASTGGAAPGNTTAPFSIGSLADSQGYFDGLIDDVVILKGYILDATERTEDYNSGTGVAFEDWDAGGGITGDFNVIGGEGFVTCAGTPGVLLVQGGIGTVDWDGTAGTFLVDDGFGYVEIS